MGYYSAIYVVCIWYGILHA